MSALSMETSAQSSTIECERRFYLWMALLIAATVLTSFGGYLLVGYSSFRSPWWVHVHAVTYMGWIALYPLQNIFVVRGKLNSHRQLGRVMGVWMVWMVVVGLVLLPTSIAAHRAPPPIFTAEFLLAMDGLNVLVFGGLILSGLHLRNQGDWHRRLMFAGTVSIIAPALGRMTQLLWGFSWRDVVLLQLALITAAAVFDIIVRSKVHRAHIWSAGAITLTGLAVPQIAKLSILSEFATSLLKP